MRLTRIETAKVAPSAPAKTTTAKASASKPTSESSGPGPTPEESASALREQTLCPGSLDSIANSICIYTGERAYLSCLSTKGN